ncbi:MAG: Stp1/IreP family PP2C-type Ser/Thr phosphatase [Gallionella sp.]|nr:Stp1/IreP family PP2C-type Ser/Thr phosphatase [Gallionella sp.]MDD4960314.1 Stp1/IreP family PP2C-type Ser/Thr phosphatase [Gallionella sp.]
MKVMNALQVIAKTHSGMVRAHNEDTVDYNASNGLVVLADGMGGYNAGEVASGIAVSVVLSEISQYLQSGSPLDIDADTGEESAVSLLRKYICQANGSIFKAAEKQPQFTGMGTTIVAGLFYDNRVAVAHVGDSRMYRLRGEILIPVTRDHSFLQEQIDCGVISSEEARHSRNKNLVTRAVGIDEEVSPEIHVHEVRVGDVYLLCSDGLNDMVADEDIQSVLYAMQGNLPLAAEQLIQTANDQGGKDNVSVILVKVIADFAEPRGWLTNLLNRFKT